MSFKYRRSDLFRPERAPAVGAEPRLFLRDEALLPAPGARRQGAYLIKGRPLGGGPPVPSHLLVEEREDGGDR